MRGGRVSIEDYYTETIKIITVSSTSQFSTVGYTESCSTASAAVNPVGGVESFTGGHNEMFADYKAFMSDTVSITDTQAVTWSGERFNVVFVKDTLNKGHHKLVFLKNDVRQAKLAT